MRPSVLCNALITAAFLGVASSQLFLPSFWGPRNEAAHRAAPQAPIMNIPSIPTIPSNEDNPTDPRGPLMISDVIGIERRINIFAGFTRDVEAIAHRLDDAKQNTTVLAPDNSAMVALPRKPWEDPREYAAMGESAYDGAAGEDRAQRNMRRFVEAHVVPSNPWKEGQKLETIGGGKIWYESHGGKRVIQPGNIEVLSIAKKATNGEIWVLKNVLNYA